MIRQLLLMTPLLAFGQPRMSVPALGYVFDDNAKAIRLVSGVPGAASLDEAVPAGTSLDSAFVHSRARVAVANTKDGAVAVVQWSGTPRVTTLVTALGRLTQVAFSRSGDRAAISDGAAVEMWSALGGEPMKTATFRPDDGIAALAMNEEGAVAAATGAGAILLLGDETRVVAADGDWTALAFLPNGGDLLAVDSATQTLALIREVQNGAAPSILASLGPKPGPLAVAADGTRAAVALAEDLTVVSLASGDVWPVSCGCHAIRFDPLEGNLVLHMAGAQPGGTLLLDADAADPRIAVVPEPNGGAGQ